MPRLVFHARRFIYEHALGEDLRREVERIVQQVILDAFPLGNDERHIEIRWVKEENGESSNTSDLDVDVLYSVGENGFDISTAGESFTLALQTAINEGIGRRFLPNGTLESVGSWPMPQMHACWGRLTRSEWMEAQRNK